MFLEDIAIQCHTFTNSKKQISKDARNAVWHDAHTQYYARQIFGARGSQSLLPGAVDVTDGICLNVNGPGGASASIVVQRCCSVSVHVIAFSLIKVTGFDAAKSPSANVHAESQKCTSFPCAFCKSGRKRSVTPPNPARNEPKHQRQKQPQLDDTQSRKRCKTPTYISQSNNSYPARNEQKHQRQQQPQLDETQPRKRCKTPTYISQSNNSCTPLPPLSEIAHGSRKLRMREINSLRTLSTPTTPPGHLRHLNPMTDNEAVKDKVRTAAPIIRTSVMRKLDFQVPVSEAKYEMNTSELFDLHFNASDSESRKTLSDDEENSQTEGYDPVFSQLPRLPEGVM